MEINKVSELLNFKFLTPIQMEDNSLILQLNSTSNADLNLNRVPSYHFDIILKNLNKRIGYIDFRVALNERLSVYGGHVGYGIDTEFRGHNYAAKSCLLLFEFIKKHNLKEILITCDPNNIASKRTCEIIGGKLIKTEKVEIEPNILRDTCYFIIKL